MSTGKFAFSGAALVAPPAGFAINEGTRPYTVAEYLRGEENYELLTMDRATYENNIPNDALRDWAANALKYVQGYNTNTNFRVLLHIPTDTKEMSGEVFFLVLIDALQNRCKQTLSKDKSRDAGIQAISEAKEWCVKPKSEDVTYELNLGDEETSKAIVSAATSVVSA